MKISTNLDKESGRAFHDGSETFFVLHAAVNLLLYRGMEYCFAIRGMVLLPQQIEISGPITDILVNTTENNRHITLWSRAWSKALKRCSRVAISFFANGTSEPQYGLVGVKDPRFCAQIHLFEKKKTESFFKVDMALTQVRVPSFFFKEEGPDYRLDGSLKWEE